MDYIDLRNPKVSIGHSHKYDERRNRSKPLGAFMFSVSLFLYTLVGIYCAVVSPTPQSKAAGFTIPENATCMRVTRYADYTTADVAIGTPFRQFSLLLRLDRVLNVSEARPAMRLFSQLTTESSTVSCDVDGNCEDVYITQFGTAAHHHHVAVSRFAYSAHADEASVSAALSLDGELFMRAGNHYWLTATQLCHAEVQSYGGTNDTLNARVYDGKLVAEIASLAHNSLLDNSPVKLFQDESSKPESVSTVELFPVLAALESNFLTITDLSLYNREPHTVDVRRTIVELGTTWATNIKELDKYMVLYQIDCGNRCSTQSTVPFRRLATTSISLEIDSMLHVRIWASHDRTLSNLPKMADSTDAFISSLIKLGAVLMAASVVFVRAKRATASSSWLFLHCTQTANGDNNKRTEETNTSEDAVVGALAFATRGLLVGLRASNLIIDDHLRVVVTEAIATVLSLIHWLLRYSPWGVVDGNVPLTRLGGSTAIMDSSAAVMMAFAETPTLVVSIGRFDPTARLLTALLLCLIVVTRCAFSASCCGVLWQSEMDKHYMAVLIYSGVAWMLQITALAVLVSDLFAAPCAYSASRNLVGNTTPIRAMLFLAIFSAGLPRLTATARHIISGKEKND